MSNLFLLSSTAKANVIIIFCRICNMQENLFIQFGRFQTKIANFLFKNKCQR